MDDWDRPLPGSTGQLAAMIRTRPLRGWALLTLLVACFFLIVGMVSTLSFFIGLPFALLAYILDRPRFHCDACGNPVVNTAQVCPTCRCRLTHPRQLRKIEDARARAGLRRTGG